MASGITFSGFNNIDFSYILNAIMQQESQPVVTLQAQQRALQSQQSAFSTLASKLSALETAMAPRRPPSAATTSSSASWRALRRRPAPPRTRTRTRRRSPAAARWSSTASPSR
jgi:Flagellar hook-associated protein 2 N-terminus